MHGCAVYGLYEKLLVQPVTLVTNPRPISCFRQSGPQKNIRGLRPFSAELTWTIRSVGAWYVHEMRRNP